MASNQGERRGTKVTETPSSARHHHNTFRGHPDLAHAGPHLPGLATCNGCHAIWEHKRWTLDEPRYLALVKDKAIAVVRCPGCVRTEGGEFDGEVTLRSPLIPLNEQAVLGLIYNTERHVREHNPIERIARLKLEGDTVHILTIGTFLAERIGKELKKAYHGELHMSRPEREEFVRVTWFREDPPA